MATFFLILLIIFAFATITVFIVTFCTKDEHVKDTYAQLCLVFFVLTMSSGMFHSFTKISERPKEFPAAKYELKYKVTEFDGVSDTTYVLIPKKNE